MMTRGAARMTRVVMGHMGPRYFSTAVLRNEDAGAGYRRRCRTLHGFPVNPSEKGWQTWVRHFPVMCSRSASTVALNDKQQEDSDKKVENLGSAAASSGGDGSVDKSVVSYWGVPPSKITKPDGTEWKWNCFRRRYGCRAMMLETVAAVPGMVGGMLLHCKSLRRFEQSGGWIKTLLEEAENERMHLMTFMEVAKPKWYDEPLVFAVRSSSTLYFVTYLLSPKLAHRIVGYLEEEAIHSYTEFLKELDNGNIENVPAPAIAIDYWRLPKDSTLRDVVLVVRLMRHITAMSTILHLQEFI
ncbi:Alternative oxidase, mitochondrial precursor [Datura stramonium]|uniref:Ubiquinol oxidase n=1 Tax=Datura stramonium TaxID=4076 RepID=A0ABS8S1D0_DATST|nr:Alternative oxidase, mitochondrial precursor [Datura stramonium]